MNPFFSKKSLAAVMLAAWLATLAAGVWRWYAYSYAPGQAGAAPVSWPGGAQLARDPAGATAVLTLHPECECSAATLTELEGILAHSAGRVNVAILFVQLPGLPPVESSALWHRAERITGVRLIRDVAGQQARRLGARTSGEVTVYGPDGHLRFHGGITLARGHVGENPGAAAVLAQLSPAGSVVAPVTTPVFGCALWDDCAPST